MYKCSFILQEIRPPELSRSKGVGTLLLWQLVYLGMLLGLNWQVGAKNVKLWVIGSIMGELITASKRANKMKVPKYVYDRTSKDPRYFS